MHVTVKTIYLHREFCDGRGIPVGERAKSLFDESG
jgi:hypothetical protein